MENSNKNFGAIKLISRFALYFTAIMIFGWLFEVILFEETFGLESFVNQDSGDIFFALFFAGIFTFVDWLVHFRRVKRNV